MRTYNNLYPGIYDLKNLILAHKRARKGKTKKDYVRDFEENIAYNLKVLYEELKNQTYQPRPLQTFILRDPKTRKISKADFRDRIVHHALVRVIEPIFDKTFIVDNCANRIGKGTLFALRRLEKFRRKITNNFSSSAFCLKVDIKHYFQEVNHDILASIIKRKIKCEKTIWLIKQIMQNNAETRERERERERETRASSLTNKGMPLGNLTSQFFANVYLNELDRFVKFKLRAKYYLRYVDDFVILHKSKVQLEIWKKEISQFLTEKLQLELHPDKSKIINLSRGIDFVGFRNFYRYKLLRKRNIKNMKRKIILYNGGGLPPIKLSESFEGWNAYAKWANTYGLRKLFFRQTLKAQFIL